MQHRACYTGDGYDHCTSLDAGLIRCRTYPQLIRSIQVMVVNPVEHEHYNRQEDKGHPDAGEFGDNED
ncbi:hypothetical protein D3C86_2159830 [compost metagenome]